MTVILSSLTVGQAVTVINFFVAAIQYTLPLFLVVLLVYFMPRTNSALAWNSISQTLHSSLWPTLLRTDSDRLTGSGLAVRVVSLVYITSTVLLPVSRVVLPLGLHDGPLVPSEPIRSGARYLRDTSSLKLATSAGRDSFRHGFKCALEDSGCDSNGITATIPPSLNDIFQSTPHNPFTIQYRQFFNTDGQAASIGYPGSAETFLTRNDTLVAEGLVIDMTSSHPGVGFINHTVPNVFEDHASGKHRGGLGGTWSRDILFLEPITSCVDTNVTAEYVFEGGLSASDVGLYLPVENYNITDRGGFVNLPEGPSSSFANYTGEDFNLWKHAYNGAVLATFEMMRNLNTSRTTSYLNKTYSVTYDLEDSDSDVFPLFLGRATPFPLEILPKQDPPTLQLRRNFLRLACSGFGGQDLLSISNIHVTCGMFLGPPVRTDGGESDVYEPGSRWMQNIHVCASATSASIELFSFSLPSFTDELSITDMQATRGVNRSTVLWAMEKRNATVVESIPLWGRIDNQYLNSDLSLVWTTQSDHFLLPATSGSFGPDKLPEGSPQNAHATVWSWVYAYIPMSVAGAQSYLPDYSGRTDFSMKTKFQDVIAQYGPTTGAEIVLSLIWTDMMANQLVGTTKSDVLDVGLYQHTLDYDFRLAVPGYLLALIWFPVFLLAISFLAFRQLRWTYFKAVYNHLSIGRVLTGSSALRVISELALTNPPDKDKLPHENDTEHRDWGKFVGQSQLTLVSRCTGQQAETLKLMEARCPRTDHD